MTFQLVAQCLNQLCYCVHFLFSKKTISALLFLMMALCKMYSVGANLCISKRLTAVSILGQNVSSKTHHRWLWMITITILFNKSNILLTDFHTFYFLVITETMRNPSCTHLVHHSSYHSMLCTVSYWQVSKINHKHIWFNHSRNELQ
jgi:hypothetical protein